MESGILFHKLTKVALVGKGKVEFHGGFWGGSVAIDRSIMDKVLHVKRSFGITTKCT